MYSNLQHETSPSNCFPTRQHQHGYHSYASFLIRSLSHAFSTLSFSLFHKRSSISISLLSSHRIFHFSYRSSFFPHLRPFTFHTALTFHSYSLPLSSRLILVPFARSSFILSDTHIRTVFSFFRHISVSFCSLRFLLYPTGHTVYSECPL